MPEIIMPKKPLGRESITLYEGDCLELLKSLPSESVDLIITSPPYCIGKAYENPEDDIETFKKQHILIFPELYRILKTGGSICWQVGYHVDKGSIIPLDFYVYDIFTSQNHELSVPLVLRNRIVWTFGHGLNSQNRFSGRHELILWFTKGDKYQFNLDAVRIPQKYPGKKSYRGPNKGNLSGNPAGKNPSDVWEATTDVWDIPNVKANHIEKTDHPSRIKVFYVYISTNEISEETKCRYPLINFIEPHSLNYFNRMAQCIKRSARFEFFRFLGVGTKDIGFVKSGTQQMIETPIICPEDWTGLHNGEKVVSFMMSAESLLQTCYVLRKDNWDDSSQLYQRLIEKEKIRSIRSFLLKHGQAFYNNIIVALPSSVRFTDGTGYYTIDQIDPQKNYTMMVPDEINSICVIDGQHRIFSHYEGPESDKSEPRIRELRSKLHLLVTGIVFPDQMTSLQKSKAQSQIFLDINSNAKPVPADVLLHIEKLQNPFSDLGLARQVIERLNRRDVFLNKFELSSLDDSKIKVASIIKFALRYLVTMKPADGKVSLYTYWTGDKAALEAENEDALKQYLDYLTTTLTCYFSAIRSVYKSEWENPDSKILSVTSLNGFIIAYTRQLPTNRVNGFEFYASRIPKLTVKFTKEDFPYASSQYRKFSDKILEDCFGISEDT